MTMQQTRPSNGVWGVLVVFVVLLIAGSATFYFTFVLPPKLLKRHKREARHTAMQLKKSIQTFHTEYQTYPLTAPPATATHSILSDHSLIDPLVGADNQVQPGGLNHRGISFFSSRRAAGNSKAGYRSGILYASDGGGELFDPWGNYYRVRLDLDGNGRVSDPESASPGETIPQTVLVWSPGPDGKDSTTEDNIVTW